jgi:diaminohydroxyphosphoribosylaminopyrimidine deaminase / 5-amino-6-(5-phosphoribosylamino)uracil reductase
MIADATFMERALFLAERGRGRTTPNPIVGAVVVSPEGVVVGQGAHLQAGTPHAEIHALEAAGDRARGATLYCTLEPCSHVGRTGPCAHAIASAHVARVVVAVPDPNPQVSGAGIAYLRSRGIAVQVGEGAEEASRQNAAFFTWITRRRPFVIMKTAASADGFVGRLTQRIKLTGHEADRWFHRQRAEVDALAVGSGTVLVDNPVLTPRMVYRERPLTRVIFDRRGRVPPDARVFSTLAAGPVIMIVSRSASHHRRASLDRLAGTGVTIEVSDGQNLQATLGLLANRDIVSLLVEGGPTLQQAFWLARLVDRVQMVSTPHRLGSGVASPPALSGLGPADRTWQLGADTLREFDVHRSD